jgi:hypothetical protein
MKRKVTWFLIAFPVLVLSCGTPSEPVTKVLARVGDVDLAFKDQSLEHLNNILQTQGREKAQPETNTRVFEWFDGAVRAKFIEARSSASTDPNSQLKLIELEIRREPLLDRNFRGSILGVHISDSPDKIPTILSKAKCRSIEQSNSYGSATCNEQWSVIWFLEGGELSSFEVSNLGYVRVPVPR